MFRVAAACFFVSGSAALLYEVVWLRLLSTVFGHTVHAVTTVLAAYMGGLALGSVLAGRRADRLARPLRAYAVLEALIAVWCLATPWLFTATEVVYLAIYRRLEPGALGSALLHFVLAGVVLVPPTALMGATLPVLSRVVARTPGVPAARVGTLYAINTWGAVVGTAATGFLLLPAIGLSGTIWLGVALDVAVAALALVLDRRPRAAPAGSGVEASPRAAPAAEEPAGPPRAPGRRGGAAVALAIIAISGAASMAYEIAWTRALAMALGSSTYGFSAMLATFLVGLALGALLAARWLRGRPAGLAALGVVELGIALAGLLTLPLLGLLPEALLALLGRVGVSYAAALGAQLVLSFLVMIVPTLLVGATFPLAIAAVAGDPGRLGRDVGVVYGWNTLGTILGSALTGFVLVPAIGIQAAVLVAAGANVVAGLAAVAAAGAAPRARLAALGAVPAFAALALALPRWDPKMMTVGVPVYAAEMVKGGVGAVRAAQQRRELLYYAEGLATTVAVSRTATATSLSVNGKTDAGNSRDMVTQLLLGHLGAVLHPEPRRALVIGLASGITAGALAQHPLDAIDVAELEPAMREASRFFEKENRGVLADPRVRVVEGDGRQILAAATRPYDLVVSEPSNPWIAGIAGLFTRDFYESVQRRLAPGGVVVQWLQAYSIFPADMQMVVRTFQEVFPHVSIWTGSLGDVLLVATPGPARLDWSVVEARLRASPGVREDFERYRWTEGRLAFRFFLGEDDARRFGAGAPINTDDRPRLEFSAPLALYGTSAPENKAFMRRFRSVDRPALAGIDPALVVGPAARLRAAREALREGRPEDAEAELERLPETALDAAGRLERARLLFSIGRLEEAWAGFEPLAASGGEAAAAGTYLALLRELAAPQLAGRAAAATVSVGGRVYAEPGALGELVLNVAMARSAPVFLPVAIEELGRAIELAPARTAAMNNQAIALAGAGRSAEAAAVLERALAVNPDEARTHFNLGSLHERDGRPREAAAAFLEAARRAPGWPPPRQRLAALGIAPPP